MLIPESGPDEHAELVAANSHAAVPGLRITAPGLRAQVRRGQERPVDGLHCAVREARVGFYVWRGGASVRWSAWGWGGGWGGPVA